MVSFAQPLAAPKVSTAIHAEAKYRVDSAFFKQEDFVPRTHVPVGQHDISAKQRVP
jgi:hypothetical protein